MSSRKGDPLHRVIFVPCFAADRNRSVRLGSPKHVSGVRFLDSLQAQQAAHLVVGSVSYAERAGFDSLACYRTATWRAAHLGVMAVPHTAGAGFDSLARYLTFR